MISKDLKKSKVLAAAQKKLKKINSKIKINCYKLKTNDKSNILKFIKEL